MLRVGSLHRGNRRASSVIPYREWLLENAMLDSLDPIMRPYVLREIDWRCRAYSNEERHFPRSPEFWNQFPSSSDKLFA